MISFAALSPHDAGSKCGDYPIRIPIKFLFSIRLYNRTNRLCNKKHITSKYARKPPPLSPLPVIHPAAAQCNQLLGQECLAQWQLGSKVFRVVSCSSEKLTPPTSLLLPLISIWLCKSTNQLLRKKKNMLHQTLWTVSDATFDFTGCVTASCINRMRRTTLLQIPSTSETQWEKQPRMCP